MEPPVRAAIVGAGLMGRWHAHELVRAGGILVGVMDRDRDAARRLAARHPASGAFADFERLLAEAAPEVLHVCTPLASHVELAERALQAGVHVLIEKPLAPDAPATERLIDLARSSDLLLCPVHQYLFQSGFRRAEKAISRIGPLRHVETTSCSAGAVGLEGSELDRTVAEIVPNLLAVMQRLLPAGCEGLEWCALRPVPGELRGMAAAGMTSVTICVSLAGRPTCNLLRAIGEKGTIHLDFFHGFGFVEGGVVSRPRKVLRPFTFAGRMAAAAAVNLGRRTLRREPAYPGLRELIGRLYRAIRSGSPSPILPAEALAAARGRDRLLVAWAAGV